MFLQELLVLQEPQQAAESVQRISTKSLAFSKLTRHESETARCQQSSTMKAKVSSVSTYERQAVNTVLQQAAHEDAVTLTL